MNLKFQTVPLIESGLGKISILTNVCDQLNVKKPIIISDEGVTNLGFVKKIEQILKRKNIFPCVYKKVLADPPEDNIFEAVNLFKKFKADGVIGLGGGSPMDVAKAVSYFSINNIEIKKCYGVNKLKKKKNTSSSNSYNCRNWIRSYSNCYLYPKKSTKNGNS